MRSGGGGEAVERPLDLLDLVRKASREAKPRYRERLERLVLAGRATPIERDSRLPGYALVHPRLLAHHEILLFDRCGRVEGLAANVAEAVHQINETSNFGLRFDVAKALLRIYLARWPNARPLSILPPIIGDTDGPQDAFRDDKSRDVQIAPRRDAIATFAIFCGIRHAFGVQLNVLHHCRLAKHRANVVYLRDFSQNMYLTGVRSLGNVESTCKALTEMFRGLGASSLVFIGNSGGTFGALYYATLLNADRVLLFSGPTSLDIGLEEAERQSYPRLLELRAAGKVEWPNLREICAQRPIPVSIYFGGKNRVDRRQAENMAELPNVSLHPIPMGSHFVLDRLAQRGVLDEIFASALSKLSDRSQKSADSLDFGFDAAPRPPLNSLTDRIAQKGTCRMNKNDLTLQLSERAGLDKNQAAKAVDGLFDIISETLKKGDEVRLTGFGVFAVSERKGGKGRNPQTGEEIVIKPSKAPRFRPGKQLKDALNS